MGRPTHSQSRICDSVHLSGPRSLPAGAYGPWNPSALCRNPIQDIEKNFTSAGRELASMKFGAIEARNPWHGSISRSHDARS